MAEEAILRSDAEQWAKDCKAREPKMTEWEIAFIDNILHRIKADYWLTENQKKKIGDIWDRVTKGG